MRRATSRMQAATLVGTLLVVAGASGCSSAATSASGGTASADAMGDGSEIAQDDKLLAATYKSGSRLRAQTLHPVGGDVAGGVFVGWYDTKLNTTCSFVQLADGSYRCMPLGESGLHVFSTPTCTPGTDLMAMLQFAGQPSSCEIGYVWHGYADTQCAKATVGKALKVGPKANADLSTHPFVQTYFGACNPRSKPPPPPDPGPQWLYCTVEEVANTEFVAATTSVLAKGPLRLQVLIAEDGSEQPYALLHPDLDVALVRDWATGAQWLPNVPAISTATVIDPTCSVVASCLPSQDAGCLQAVVESGDACSNHAFRLTTKVITAKECNLGRTPGDEIACFERGANLAQVPYEERALGTARLRPVWSAAAGVPVLPDETFWDEALQSYCRAEKAVDGQLRCLPFSPISAGSGANHGWRAVYGSVNAKGQCETFLGYRFESACGLAAPSVVQQGGKYVRMTPSGAPSTTKLFSGIGPPGNEVFQCQPFVDATTMLYAPTPLATSDFVELKQAVAP